MRVPIRKPGKYTHTKPDPYITKEKFIELKSNYTIILVTHILRQARRIADHVIFMYLGEIIEQGPAVQIFENPKEEKTKSYFQGMFY